MYIIITCTCIYSVWVVSMWYYNIAYMYMYINFDVKVSKALMYIPIYLHMYMYMCNAIF